MATSRNSEIYFLGPVQNSCCNFFTGSPILFSGYDSILADASLAFLLADFMILSKFIAKEVELGWRI